MDPNIRDLMTAIPGRSIGECRNALIEAKNDVERAKAILLKRPLEIE